jgi:hypothetical protein
MIELLQLAHHQFTDAQGRHLAFAQRRA